MDPLPSKWTPKTRFNLLRLVTTKFRQGHMVNGRQTTDHSKFYCKKNASSFGNFLKGCDLTTNQELIGLEVLPALGFDLHRSTAFGDQEFSFFCFRDMPNKMHIRMLFQFGEILLINRK